MTIEKTVMLVASYAPSLINFRGPLIQELVSRNYKVIVCAPDIDAELTAALENLGAEVHETPMVRTGLNPLTDISYMNSLNKLIKKTRPDFVLTYTIKPNIWGGFAAALNRVASASMITGLGFAFTDISSMKKRVVRKIAARLYRLSTAANEKVIFQNPDDRDDFIKAGCLAKPSKARLVNGSGVDTAHFSPAPLPDGPVFLMISRLLGNKGVREYCRAAARVKQQIPETRFLLVGYRDEGPDGIREEELLSWTDAGVEFLGSSVDVRQEISMASIYVLPSYREGTPRSVLEAMSMGRAIITSDAPGCRETTTDGVNGYLVPVRNVDALVERMVWLAENKSKRKTMGAASRKIAVEKYDVHQVNRMLLEHLNIP